MTLKKLENKVRKLKRQIESLEYLKNSIYQGLDGFGASADYKIKKSSFKNAGFTIQLERIFEIEQKIKALQIELLEAEKIISALRRRRNIE